MRALRLPFRSYLRTSIYTFNLTTLGTGQVNLGDLSTRSPSSSTTSTAARATRLSARGTPISPSGSYEAFSFNTLLLCTPSVITRYLEQNRLVPLRVNSRAAMPHPAVRE